MDDCLTVASSPADTNQRSTDGAFDFAMNCAGELLATVVTRAPLGRAPLHSETSDWIARTLSPVPVLSLPPVLEDHGVFLSAAEQQYRTQISEELHALGEPLKSSEAAEQCKHFAETGGLALSNQIGTRWAIFGDELDGIALVAHSQESKRQVTFEFAMQGSSIKIIQIDERMRRSEHSCRIEHARQLENAIAWLNLS